MSGVAVETAAAVHFLKKMAEKGKLKAVIDKKYALEQVAAAHAYVDTGRKKGNVVIAV
jgi:NADPH:quinone reductase-like Zn-dependent oxidoreductase